MLRFAALALVSLVGMVVIGSAWAADAPPAQPPAPPGGGPGAPPAIAFNRDVRPILSDHCFVCHGPDAAHRKADLRLDTEQGLFGRGENGPAVVRGDPKASAAWARVVADDPDELMPPADAHKPLSADQKATLKRWIEQGAAWEPHWSLKPPARPAVPAVRNAAWVRNPVDAFVLAKLESAGLSPAPETDRRTLARRLSLDLVGLPPDPAEVEAFAADSSPAAYEAYVDRLMAKPQWGEHRGRYWLDAARYGDTHGVHNDNYREMWPYRDNVIAAFNANRPFDRFVVEQLAGDLLPGRTLEQQVASGFQRCNITTSEGGSIPDEVQAGYDKDRVETTGTVFLGLTVGCAACHDHKFDPVSQKDFYALAAFYRNTTQNPMDGNAPDTPPVVAVPRPADRPRWDALARDEAALSAERRQERDAAAERTDAWLAAGEHRRLPSAPPVGGVRLDVGPPRSNRVRADAPAAPVIGFAWNAGSLDLPLPAGVTAGDGPPGERAALRFAAAARVDFPFVHTSTDEPFSAGGWVLVPPADSGSFAVAAGVDDAPAAAPAAASPAATADKAPPPPPPTWSLSIENRVPTFRLFGGRDEKIEVRGRPSARLPAGKWVHLFVAYDGGRDPFGVTLYVNGKAEPTDAAATATKPLAGPPRAATAVRLGGDGRRDLNGGGVAGFKVFGDRALPDEVALLSRWAAVRAAAARDDPAKLTPAEREDLLLVRLLASAGSYKYRAASGRLADVEAEQRRVRARSPVTHVMAEMPTPAKSRLLFRGQYDQPRDELTAATPAALHAFPDAFPRNRLGLAWWLVDSANPLTSRVTVNRFWQELFGTGIVRTSEDFGVTGEHPSHPELLDWLAVEFRSPGDGGPAWDVKRFYKLLVTSAAYRQAAAATPAKLKLDPRNRLLSRGPRFRLDAEVLRDAALASSGLLVPAVGGPSVKPYQPPGVWEAVAMFGSNTRFYKPDAGEALYRRSLYTFWKRSAPPASMDVLNAPTREVCTVRRERTNTPLQALVTLNDPQWVEAARHLAQRALTVAGSDGGAAGDGSAAAAGGAANGGRAGPADDFDARLDFVTARVLARPMELGERRVCRASLDDFLAAYAASPEAAKQLIATGESKPDPKLSPAELAAWTMLVSQVMNTDEALNK